MPREPLVDERMARVEQLDDAVLVGAKDAVEEELHLALERVPQVLVERRIETRIGIDRAQVAHGEPLEREARDERPRAGILEHAANLGFVDAGLAKPPLLREREQRIVRTAAPQEERQPPRELDVVDLVRL